MTDKDLEGYLKNLFKYVKNLIKPEKMPIEKSPSKIDRKRKAFLEQENYLARERALEGLSESKKDFLKSKPTDLELETHKKIKKNRKIETRKKERV